MGTHPSDSEKQTQECRDLVAAGKGRLSCPNMKETGGGFEGEQYRCKVCGGAVYLDYEEMK